MPDDELAQRAARHRPNPYWHGRYCFECGNLWGEYGCDAARLAAALAAEQAARARAEAALRQYADADNWADTRGVDWLSRWVGDDEGPAIARAALAGEEGR